jgi:hypothetical protein
VCSSGPVPPFSGRHGPAGSQGEVRTEWRTLALNPRVQAADHGAASGVGHLGQLRTVVDSWQGADHAGRPVGDPRSVSTNSARRGAGYGCSATLISSGSRMPSALVPALSGVAWLHGGRRPARRRLGGLVRAADGPVTAHALRILQLVKPPRVRLSLFLVSHLFPPLARDRWQSRS